MEHMFKHIFLLLKCLKDTPETPLSSSLRAPKLGMGDFVRLIKAQQKDSVFFQNTDRIAVGAVFDLMDNIVLLRNKHMHGSIGGDSRQAVADLQALLQCVDQFCNSWFLDKLLGEP
jgi:hypothetical protein